MYFGPDLWWVGSLLIINRFREIVCQAYQQKGINMIINGLMHKLVIKYLALTHITVGTISYHGEIV